MFGDGLPKPHIWFRPTCPVMSSPAGVQNVLPESLVFVGVVDCFRVEGGVFLGGCMAPVGSQQNVSRPLGSSRPVSIVCGGGHGALGSISLQDFGIGWSPLASPVCAVANGNVRMNNMVRITSTFFIDNKDKFIIFNYFYFNSSTPSAIMAKSFSVSTGRLLCLRRMIFLLLEWRGMSSRRHFVPYWSMSPPTILMLLFWNEW